MVTPITVGHQEHMVLACAVPKSAVDSIRNPLLEMRQSSVVCGGAHLNPSAYRQRQEDLEFETSVSIIGSETLSQANNKNVHRFFKIRP